VIAGAAQTARLIYIAAAAGGCRRMTPPRKASSGSPELDGPARLLSCSSVVLTRWGPRETKRLFRPMLSVAD